MASIPHLNEVYRRYKGQGLVLVGVHGDEDTAKAKSTAKEKKVAYPVVQFDPKVTLRNYRVMGFPTVFVIDKKGRVRFVDPPDLDAAVKKLLKEK